MKIRPVGTKFLADRRTDMKLIVAFRNFARAPHECEWAGWVGLDQIWSRGGLLWKWQWHFGKVSVCCTDTLVIIWKDLCSSVHSASIHKPCLTVNSAALRILSHHVAHGSNTRDLFQPFEVGYSVQNQLILCEWVWCWKGLSLPLWINVHIFCQPVVRVYKLGSCS